MKYALGGSSAPRAGPAIKRTATTLQSEPSGGMRQHTSCWPSTKRSCTVRAGAAVKKRCHVARTTARRSAVPADDRTPSSRKGVPAGMAQLRGTVELAGCGRSCSGVATMKAYQHPTAERLTPPKKKEIHKRITPAREGGDARLSSRLRLLPWRQGPEAAWAAGWYQRPAMVQKDPIQQAIFSTAPVTLQAQEAWAGAVCCGLRCHACGSCAGSALAHAGTTRPQMRTVLQCTVRPPCATTQGLCVLSQSWRQGERAGRAVNLLSALEFERGAPGHGRAPQGAPVPAAAAALHCCSHLVAGVCGA